MYDNWLLLTLFLFPPKKEKKKRRIKQTKHFLNLFFSIQSIFTTQMFPNSKRLFGQHNTQIVNNFSALTYLDLLHLQVDQNPKEPDLKRKWHRFESLGQIRCFETLYNFLYLYIFYQKNQALRGCMDSISQHKSFLHSFFQ